VVLVLCPATVALQAVMPRLFPWWTRDAFGFDPYLLCLLSAGVLVNTVSLPAVAICVGNNLVTVQLRTALTAAAVLFAALVPATASLGIRGAAVALLLSEATATVMYVHSCRAWLDGAGLEWPARAFRESQIAIAAAIGSAALMAAFPAWITMWLAVYGLSTLKVSLRLWRLAPPDARDYVLAKLRGLPFVPQGGRA
jgi:hypothetical protein